MPSNNLFELLQQAVDNGPGRGLTVYNTLDGAESAVRLTYQQLLDAAEKRSQCLVSKHILEEGSIVLLHLHSQLDNIIWFWSIILAGCVPCVSTPFPSDADQQHKHIGHLQQLLGFSVVVTSTNLLTEFSRARDLNIVTIEDVFDAVPANRPGHSTTVSDAPTANDLSRILYAAASITENDDAIPCHSLDGSALRLEVADDFHCTACNIDSQTTTGSNSANTNTHRPVYTGIESQLLDSESQSCLLTAREKSFHDLAVLMLTSGSTGNPKAVPLRHGQILKAIEGKSTYHDTNSSDVFLNWVGLDHVANLTETHLHAMSLAAEQIHLPKDVVGQPLAFLDAVEKHKVSYSFAPNFFLAAIVRSLSEECLDTNDKERPTGSSRDLSSLKALISGGESNVIETCIDLTQLLRKYGAPASFIRPGFGMTETCAGSIYSKNCPAYDQQGNMEFASLGFCIPGISAMIFREDGTFAKVDEIGTLRVRGDIVFQGYYNDEEATVEAFTHDNWFNTGDLARLDAAGALHIVGRNKETMIINGINHSPQGVEAAIDEAAISGATPSYTVVFSHRPKGSPTERLCVIYLPTYAVDDGTARIDTSLAISRICVSYCNVRPYLILPLEPLLLVKSSLGKLSRIKIRKAFESGLYQKHKDKDEMVLRELRAILFEAPTSKTELAIVAILKDLFDDNTSNIGVNSNLFDFGVSSVDVLTFRQQLQSNLQVYVPITVFFSYPVIRQLAQAIEELQNAEQKYDPVVVLQPHGTKTPLFFIHPGVGEALVFMNLARYITDRPIFALRARGFDGEPYFDSIEEMVDIYTAAIKRVSPKGPYSICGYSFGSILTFEITKRLEVTGDEVKFVGVLDQPPHFKKRAQKYDWYEVACTLAFFLGLIKECYAYDILNTFREEGTPHVNVLDHVFQLAPAQRLQELGLNKKRFENWVSLAYKLKIIGRDYEPQGMVTNMDVFYVGPLPIVQAKTLEEWFDGYISKWESFAESVVFHKVQGGHRDLISPPNVASFQKLLKDVLRQRGL